MKPFFPILLLLTNLFAPAIQAQQHLDHPLAPNQNVSPRYGGADSVVISFYKWGKLAYEDYILIKRDESGRIDTVNYFNNDTLIASRIQEYSPENRLLSFYVQGKPFKMHYTYGEKGRLTAEIELSAINSDTLFSTTYTYHDHQTMYTDDGYSFFIKREKKDKEGVIQNNTYWDTYTLDQSQRLIQEKNSDKTYTYTSDGGVIIAMPMRIEEHYDHSNLLRTYIEYKFTDSTQVNRNEYTYYQNHQPLATEARIIHEETPVWGTHGGIRTTVDTPQIIQIYTLTGRLVTQTHIQPYETLPLAPGLYIVTLQKRSYKIVVPK